MKKLVLTTVLVLMGVAGWGDVTSITASLTENTNVFGTAVQSGYTFVLPVDFVDNVSSGTIFKGRSVSAYFADAANKRLQQEAPTNYILSSIVASVKTSSSEETQWVVLIPNTKGTYDEWSTQSTDIPYKLTKSSSTHQTLDCRGSLGDDPIVKAVVDVSFIDSGSVTKNKLLQANVTFDIQEATDKSFFVVDSSFSHGVQVNYLDQYNFEVDNALIKGKTPKVVRPTLMQWVLGNTISTDQALWPANVDSTLLAALTSNAASTDGKTLKYQVLRLLQSLLQMQRYENPSDKQHPVGQFWGFPTARLYQTNADHPRYSDLFFQILEKHKVLTSPATTIAELTQDQGNQLASKAKEFLLGVENGAPAAMTNLYASIMTPASGTYQPKDSLAEKMGVTLDDLKANQQPLLKWASSKYQLVWPNPEDQTAMSRSLVVFPPGPNLANSTMLNLANDAVLPTLLKPLVTPQALSTSTVTLNFNSPQTIRSLLFWIGAQADIQDVQYWDGTRFTSFKNISKNFATVNKTTGKVGQTDVVRSSLAVSNSNAAITAANLGIEVVKWDTIVSTTKINITFNSASPQVYNLRAYGQVFDLAPGTEWVQNLGETTLALTTLVTSQLPEVFSTLGRNDFFYFVQNGNTSIPAGSNILFNSYYSPISFAKNGLETPLSYNLKILNNQYWKTYPGAKATHFPLTEFDLGTVKIQEDGTYALLTHAPTANTGWNTKMYPYTYGVTLSTKTGVILSPNSPFYAEKIAGVDSTGLLLSLLKILGIVTQTQTTIQNRFEDRVNFKAYDDFLQGIKALDTASSSIDEKWFLSNSYVLTDPSVARKGDLLVGHEGSELTVAIVTDVSSDASLALQDRIQVVTINRALQRAVYTTWRQMSLSPEEYHLRRLSTSTAGADPKIIDAEPETILGFLKADGSIAYDFQRQGDSDSFGNWIPNTGELADLGKIHLKVGSEPVDIRTFDKQRWTLSSAWDYYGEDAGMDGNIAKNATGIGQTVFHLIAMKNEHKEDGVSVSSNLSGYFYQIPDSIEVAWFQCDGTSYIPQMNPALDPTQLVVADGNLAINIDNGPYIYFALIAEHPNPGDDLGLGFTINDAVGEFVTDNTKAARLAVYDKKLLWRANLYIDENNGKDWNDIHPWIGELNSDGTVNAAGVNFNAWNVASDNSTNVNGGQVLWIQPWTYWQDNTTVERTVPYSWTSWDGIFDYNKYMRREAKIIEDARAVGDLYLGSTYANLQWVSDTYHQTIAPGKNFLNYVFRGRRMGTSENHNFYDYIRDSTSSSADNFPIGYKSQLPYRVSDDYASRPVVPGLTTWHAFDEGGPSAEYRKELPNDNPTYDGSFDPSQNSTSTGVDCSGFLSRAANYTSNPYKTFRSPDTRTDTEHLALDETSWLIQPVVLTDTDAKPNAIMEYLKYAVPGDYINKASDHVVVIQNIFYPDGGVPVLRSSVQIIQAGAGPSAKFYRVLNKNPLDNDSTTYWQRFVGMGEFRNYEIRRLK